MPYYTEAPISFGFDDDRPGRNKQASQLACPNCGESGGLFILGCNVNMDSDDPRTIEDSTYVRIRIGCGCCGMRAYLGLYEYKGALAMPWEDIVKHDDDDL